MNSGNRSKASRIQFQIAIVILVLAVILPARHPSDANEFDVKLLEKSYLPEIRALVVRYCHECHSGDRAEAEIDLSTFATFAEVRKHPKAWQKVGEMLESGQMPPKDAKQPTAAERTQLQEWVRGFLTTEAKARAGDPGRVVLRRLGNAEYTHTLRDLTGISSLEPAREFPVDGAAGEGFTNTGNALVMSPSLMTKYFDAAKDVADHAVLLPDGIRFSPLSTRRDWTNETLTRIREFYRQFTDPRGGDKVNLQGIVFETNEGGRLPVEKYLAATLSEREALANGTKKIDAVAREYGLSPKYLGLLWQGLTDSKPSLLLDGLRTRWKTAKPQDAASLTADIAQWQKTLWKFNSVGHIGKLNGPQRWLESINPLVTQQEIRFKVPALPEGSEITLALLASDAGDGKEHDVVVWQQPRLVAPGRPDLLLRDVRKVTRQLAVRREQIFQSATKYLLAADEAAIAQGKANPAELAKKHGVDAEAVVAWLDYLGIGAGSSVELRGHFTNKINNSGNYEFVKGWGSNETPLLVANSSDQQVRIPGNMKPHSVAVHPSPTLRTAVGWQSPVTSLMKIEGTVTHAHPECGNGVTWALELRRGATRQRLAAGIAQGSKDVPVGPLDGVAIQTGDLVSLLVGPRDGNHSCDLTTVDLKLTGAGAGGKAWNLAADVSSDIQAGNPHADRFGNQGVWHFYTESEKLGESSGPVIPPGSLVAKWLGAKTSDERRPLSEAIQTLLTGGPPAAKESPDAALYQQMASLSGPLFGGILRSPQTGATATEEKVPSKDSAAGATEWGLDPGLFGKHPNGSKVDPGSLVVQAPSVIEVRLPADLIAGCELVLNGALHKESGSEGSVQLEVLAGKPARITGLLPSEVKITQANGAWTGNNQRSSYATPILVTEGSVTRKRIEQAFDDFRQLFPAALCYTKIVPVDEVVTLTLFYREDDHLSRLMLDEAQHAYLDRLWNELHYISQDALTLVDAYAQLMEYATQDADPKVFEPLRKPINDRAAAFRKMLVETEPRHLEFLHDFASRAYRRPVTDSEFQELRALYGRLRTQEIPHDEAFRLTLARILVSPGFLYRIEKPKPGSGQSPVSDFELASRLSYFLWSSQPDAELLQVAASGKLNQPEVLMAQTKRMLNDSKIRRMATEFACQWLHIHDFDHLDEKSDRHFPTFTGIRGAMYEESIQFFTDFFQHNGSVLDILNADYTFLNEELAKHYGIPNVAGPEW
ncbi:MAG: cytochrome, partial [Planctomycetaceae bacterium]|nr:cytochrome [Planctomycetaceae bacterium]